MTQRHTHYVDYPLAVSFNGSVAKISFGVGDASEEPEVTHTIVMPAHSFVALAKHLRKNIEDPKFREKVPMALEALMADIQEASTAA